MVMRATSPYGMPPLALWMAIAATANEGEKFSVERIIDSRQGTTDPEDPMTYVEIEEIYHTRLLIQTVSTLGVPYEMKVPPLFVRVLTMGIILLPKPLEYMVVFFAEVIGTTLFAALAERARSLVDPQSPVGARVISLVEEILIDEIGHVTYARAHLGPVRLWIAKQMTRFLARAMYKATPAIDALFDANILAERAKTLDLSTLPAHILARAYAPSAVVEAERISAK